MIRVPLQQIASYSAGTTSSSSIVNLPIGDFEALVGTVSGTISGGGTNEVYVQTQDVNGNFYDLVHVSFSATTAASNPVLFYIPTSSGQAKYVGSAGASQTAAGVISGVPVLSKTIRFVNTAVGTVSTSPAVVTLFAIGQSGGY